MKNDMDASSQVIDTSCSSRNESFLSIVGLQIWGAEKCIKESLQTALAHFLPPFSLLVSKLYTGNLPW